MRRATLLAGLLLVLALAVVAAAPAAADPAIGDETPDNETEEFRPDTERGNYSIELAVDLSDLSSTTDVTFYNASDDSIIGADTVAAPSGTATMTWNDSAASGAPQLGENRWYVGADDGKNANVSDEFVFELPSFRILEETTGDPATTTNYNVTFTTPFTAEAKQVDSTDNEIPLTNIPTDITGQQLINIDINSSDYYRRSIYADNWRQLNQAYVLNQSVDTVETTIELTDRSGEKWDPAETAIQITKPTRDNRQVAGDLLGADAKATLRLATDDNYRIRAINHDAATRQFGHYTADLQNDFIELTVGELSIEPPQPESYQFSAERTTIENSFGETPAIVVEYQDNRSVIDPLPASTASMKIVIHERGNQSNEIINQSFSNKDQIRIQETLSANQSDTEWTVRYDGERYGSQEIEGVVRVGGLGALGLPVPPELLQILGLASILLVAGLFGGRLSQIGGIVTVAVAWVLWVLEIVQLPISFLAAAAVVAVLFYAGTTDSGGIYG